MNKNLIIKILIVIFSVIIFLAAFSIIFDYVRSKNGSKRILNNYETAIHNTISNNLSVSYDMDSYKIEGTIADGIFTGNLYLDGNLLYEVEYNGYNLEKKIIDDSFDNNYLLVSINEKYLLPIYFINTFSGYKYKKLSDNEISYSINGLTYIITLGDNIISKIEVKGSKHFIFNYSLQSN